MDTEQEVLLDELRQYMKRERLLSKDIAAMLNVSANTVSNWRKGENMNPANRKAIERLVRDYASVRGDKYPDDIDFTRLCRIWPQLSEAMRSRIVSVALELLEKSGGDQIGNGVAEDRKAN